MLKILYGSSAMCTKNGQELSERDCMGERKDGLFFNDFHKWREKEMKEDEKKQEGKEERGRDEMEMS